MNHWNEANQRYLMAAVRAVQRKLERYRDAVPAEEPVVEPEPVAMPSPAAIDVLSDAFGLSLFERELLLLCAGVELDTNFANLVASLSGDPQRPLPTFSLALAAFPDAHWSAVAPGAPLRYWRFIECSSGSVITRSPLRIDEQVLCYLTGLSYMNDRLQGMVQAVGAGRGLVSSQEAVVEKIITVFKQGSVGGLPPVVQLESDEWSDTIAVAAAVCDRANIRLYTLSIFSLPLQSRELTELLRLWNREAVLNEYAIFLDTTGLDYSDGLRVQSITQFIEGLQGLLFLGTGQLAAKIRRPGILFSIPRPGHAEQLSVWRYSLGTYADGLNGKLEKLVSQFDMSAGAIRVASEEALQQRAAAAADGGEGGPVQDAFGRILWKACCRQTRPRIAELAERIEAVAGWDDIVLPEAQEKVLREVSIQVAQRSKDYQDWGFSGKSNRGLGITALFTGDSGTGKTMAAEVLASELQLDLYRIDLSQVVNKYIGETEKNLGKIFDAAEAGGAILLFDEADALFGKRGDVKDSHDRYGNIEVSYLLQRMEAYRGLAILTTNMKSALDKAFLRRIRFVVQFPFPDALLRAEIWSRVFPAATPREGLDMTKLSRLNLPGGNIRNIALNAAFMAAHEGSPVRMSHLSVAARSEYNKLEKSLNSAEMGGW